LGCGEGKLIRRLAEDPQFTEVVGMDVSTRALDIAEERLRKTRHFDEPGRVKLWHGSLMYRDARLAGFEAAAAAGGVGRQALGPPTQMVVFRWSGARTPETATSGGQSVAPVDELLKRFREQVTASGLSDAELNALFEEARNEVHVENLGPNQRDVGEGAR